MRQIKFREWDKYAQRMYSVGALQLHEGMQIVAMGTMLPDEMIVTPDCQPHIELMQFTGLCDKNGREIYEGDILRVTTGEDGESYVATVKWFGDECYPAFDLEGIPAAWNYDANALSTIFNSGVETCEVIGNIYEKNDCEGK